MLKKKTSLRVQKYLRENDLASFLSLGEFSPVGFHWANDRSSSHFVKELFNGNPKEQEINRLEQLEQDLAVLKDIPIWLMSRRGQLKSDLYNLYQCYLDPRLKNQWFDLEEILVSTAHEAGPFASIKSMRWFDANLYAKFIYLKMINSWVPQRDFRLSLDIPIEIRAGGSPLGSIQGRLHQISGHGIVLNLENLGQAKEWGDKEVMILKKPMALKDNETGIERCLRSQEWMGSLENFSVKGAEFHELIQSQIDSTSGDHYFVFIPFSKMTLLSVRAHDEAMKNLLGLFEEAQNTIQKYVKAA
jgi:hypothetical protein